MIGYWLVIVIIFGLFFWTLRTTLIMSQKCHKLNTWTNFTREKSYNSLFEFTINRKFHILQKNKNSDDSFSENNFQIWFSWGRVFHHSKAFRFLSSSIKLFVCIYWLSAKTPLNLFTEIQKDFFFSFFCMFRNHLFSHSRTTTDILSIFATGNWIRMHCVVATLACSKLYCVTFASGLGNTKRNRNKDS